MNLIAHLSNRAAYLAIVISQEPAVGQAQEADVLNRLFCGRPSVDCPWYILDLDPELVSLVPQNGIASYCLGYLASGLKNAEVLDRFHDQLKLLTEDDFAACDAHGLLREFLVAYDRGGDC